MSATFATPEKAADEAKEMNEHLGQMVDMINGKLGAKAKDVEPVLGKTKAVANGNAVSAKLAIPGEVVEKLLSKDK
jgi:hypothetical protein